MEAILCMYGSIHGSIHGDGQDVLLSIVRTCTEMLADRRKWREEWRVRNGKEGAELVCKDSTSVNKSKDSTSVIMSKDSTSVIMSKDSTSVIMSKDSSSTNVSKDSSVDNSGGSKNIKHKPVSHKSVLVERRGPPSSIEELVARIEAEEPVVSDEWHDVYIHSERKVSIKFARHVVECGRRKLERLVSSLSWSFSPPTLPPVRPSIVVSLEGPTPFARKECGDIVPFLLARPVYVHVAHHRLVPRHSLAPSAPKGVDASQLPRIVDSDAVAQYYAWPVGSVVEIERCFGGNEPIPYFRQVVSELGG